jgi:hypothetical protein
LRTRRAMYSTLSNSSADIYLLHKKTIIIKKIDN